MRFGLFLFLMCILAGHADAGENSAAPEKMLLLRQDSGLDKAEAQIKEKKYMQALETLGGVLQRHPGNADALTAIGYAYQQLGETDKASSYFDKALQSDPQHLGANEHRASLYIQSGDLARAMEQLQVIRMICSGIECAELIYLEAEMNAFKKDAKED